MTRSFIANLSLRNFKKAFNKVPHLQLLTIIKKSGKK